MRDATHKDVTANNIEGNNPDKSLNEPAIKRSAAQKIYKTAGGSPDELLKDAASLKDVAANTPLRRTQRLRKKTRKAAEPDFCDLYPYF